MSHFIALRVWPFLAPGAVARAWPPDRAASDRRQGLRRLAALLARRGVRWITSRPLLNGGPNCEAFAREPHLLALAERRKWAGLRVDAPWHVAC